MDPTPVKLLAAAAVGFVAGMGLGLAVRRGGQKKPAARKPQQPKKDRDVRKTHPAPPDGSVEIYVGNLSYDMTEPQLLAEFEKFVIMPNRAEAEKAIAALSEKEFMGRPMKVNEARNTVDKQDPARE